MIFAFVVSLYLQQGHDAVANIIVFKHAGAILLITAIEKLATVFLETGFEYYIVAALVDPDGGRAFGGFPVTGAQANNGIGKLQLDAVVFTPALFEGFGQGPDFGVGKVRYAGHAGNP